MIGLKGDVVPAVGSGFSLAIDIGAEEGEVARVPRPFPVVDFTTKLTHTSWRSIDQSHILNERAMGHDVDAPF
jgi:hypothetical protein